MGTVNVGLFTCPMLPREIARLEHQIASMQHRLDSHRRTAATSSGHALQPTANGDSGEVRHG